MVILLKNQQKKYEVCPAQIQKIAKAILNALDCPDAELSILIVDNSQIEKLNREYLNRVGPTNVLAFPMIEGEFSHITPHLLGDVVLSIETAEMESKMIGISVEKRLIQLLVHGILHLFGYNHEKNREASQRMAVQNNRILHLIDQLKLENEN